MRRTTQSSARRRETSRAVGPRGLRLAVAVALALTAAATEAVAAEAATYRAVQCHRELGAGHADLAFARTSTHYVPITDCRGEGVGVRHEPGRRPTAGGRYGAFSLDSPPGAEIVRVRARVAARAAGGHRPELHVALADGAQQEVRGIAGALHSVSWSGRSARGVRIRLRCARGRDCAAGRDARIAVRRLALTLRDLTAPTLAVGGSLLGGATVRGSETLEAVGADSGSGVRRITVTVNGEPATDRAWACELARQVALRLRPCPARAPSAFTAATARAPFRQGRNEVRVCALDFAPGTDANRACHSRRVRVDNLCPTSPVAAAGLRAGFPGGRTRATIVQGRRATVAGRVVDAVGEPVAGARVCVASTDRLADAAERVVAAPTSGPDGRFAVRLPAGPSRQVRVAHWSNEKTVLERSLALRVRARPRLRLRPRRTLRNGERLRFRVRLAGPASGGREVAVEARAGVGRWVPVTSGRTAAGGSWRGSYRFRSTTGRRRYAFRAVVKGQPGYPYRAGRSRVRRATVVG